MIIAKLYVDTIKEERCVVIEIERDFVNAELSEQLSDGYIPLDAVALSVDALTLAHDLQFDDSLELEPPCFDVSLDESGLYVGSLNGEAKIVLPKEKVHWYKWNVYLLHPIVKENGYLKVTPIRDFMTCPYERDARLYKDAIMSFLKDTHNFTMSIEADNELRNAKESLGVAKVDQNLALDDYDLQVLKNHTLYTYDRRKDRVEKQPLQAEAFSPIMMLDPMLVDALEEASDLKIDETYHMAYFSGNGISVSVEIHHGFIYFISMHWNQSMTLSINNVASVSFSKTYRFERINCTKLGLTANQTAPFEALNIID